MSRSVPLPLSGRFPQALPFLLFGLAVALQALLLASAWWPEPRVPVGDEKLYLAAATQTFDGRLVVLPPLWPPLWPHLLRPLLALGGSGAVVVAQLIVLGLAVWGLGVLARRALGAAAVAPLVVLAAADPLLGAFAHYFWPEVLFLAVVVAVALLLSAAEVGLGRGAAVGVLVGVATLLKSLFGPIAPLVVLGVGLRASPGRRWLVSLVALAVFLLVTVPFVVQAERVAPGASGASARFNLLVALREDGRSSFGGPNVALATLQQSAAQAGPRWEHRLPWIAAELDAELEQTSLLGELFDRLSRHPFRVLEWRSFLVEQLPGGGFATEERGGYRGTSAWLARTLRGWSAAHLAVLLGLAAVGVVAAPWTSRTAAVAVALFVAWQVVVLLAVHAISRYRVQLEPGLLLLAAGGWVALRRGGLSPRQWWGAAALAVVLLGCAFAGGWLDALGW